MKIILKLLLIISVFTGLFSFIAIENPTFAAKQCKTGEDCAKQLAAGSKITDPQQIFIILTKIVKYTYTTFFFVAIIFIIISAFTYLTAGDDTAKISSAHKQIFWAVIAIAIALISMGAATIIQAFITP